MRRSFVILLVVVGISLIASAGCNRRTNGDREPSASTPQSGDLPRLELKDSTPDLLLTWVDTKGDFHVVQKIADVPEPARERVRVVRTTQQAGTGKLLYVADLRKKSAAGTYPVSTMTRAEWDEIGADRRKKRLEALAPSASASGQAAPLKANPDDIAVVVYGASWCKPCHDAERYLKRRGVNVKLKDIEQDNLARAELQHKLKRANLPSTAQIPIIDVSGQLLVGFSPSALDRALRTAEAAETL
jgi:glutaredoxin